MCLELLSLAQNGPVSCEIVPLSGLRTIAGAILTSCAATRPATHSVPSHHEEAKYHHRDHNDGEYPPKTKTKKPCILKHVGFTSFRSDRQIEVWVLKFLPVFSAFWSFLSLFCFLSLCFLILAHHSPHDRAAVDGITFTSAKSLHHFSHFLKVSTIGEGTGFLGFLLLVSCLFGLHSGSPPF